MEVRVINMKVELNLPTAFYAKDYHEFDEYERFAKKLNPKLKVKEVAFGSSPDGWRDVYWAIVYCGGKPSEHKINKALFEAGYRKEEE